MTMRLYLLHCASDLNTYHHQDHTSFEPYQEIDDEDHTFSWKYSLVQSNIWHVTVLPITHLLSEAMPGWNFTASGFPSPSLLSVTDPACA